MGVICDCDERFVMLSFASTISFMSNYDLVWVTERTAIENGKITQEKEIEEKKSGCNELISN